MRRSAKPLPADETDYLGTATVAPTGKPESDWKCGSLAGRFAPRSAPPWLRIGRKFSFLADLEHLQATAQASLRTSKGGASRRASKKYAALDVSPATANLQLRNSDLKQENARLQYTPARRTSLVSALPLNCLILGNAPLRLCIAAGTATQNTWIPFPGSPARSAITLQAGMRNSQRQKQPGPVQADA
jgi:hypothetical protein